MSEISKEEVALNKNPVIAHIKGLWTFQITSICPVGVLCVG